jgi:hypothetical protein
MVTKTHHIVTILSLLIFFLFYIQLNSTQRIFAFPSQQWLRKRTTLLLILSLPIFFYFISFPVCMTEGLGCCERYLGLKGWGENTVSSCMIVITPDRKEVELKDIGWIHLAQNGDK